VASETNADSKVPTPRDAVRAVVLDRENRVLLFKAFGDDARSKHFWITPGGGVMPGESDGGALRRELAEECGLYECEIGPFVWVREHVFPLPGTTQLLRQRERYYLVRVIKHEVDVSGLDDFERKYMGEHRWWTLEEVQSSHDEFAPRLLARFLTDLVAGRIPDVPLDTGI
jgi:8-oxo-dGTP pyrophosphatase MutT (NUDIX family)